MRYHPKQKLSVIKLERLKAKRPPGRYADSEVKGLFLNIGPTGCMSWVLRYMLHGQDRHLGLGSLDNFGLAEARKRATKARRLKADPRDRSAGA